jgi:hypothetical protein
VAQLVGEFRLEVRPVKMFAHASLEPLERRDQRLRYVPATVGAESTARIGKAASEFLLEQSALLGSRKFNVGIHA